MSFPRYPAYKDSGVEWLGSVPTTWSVGRLKRHFRLLTEKAESKSNPVALENIESWTGQFTASYTQFEGDGVRFETGDILFGKLRPYLAKVLLAPWPGEAVGDFHVLRAAEGMFPRFAQYCMLTRSFIDIVDGSTFGSKMPRANWEFMGEMSFPVPSASEQAIVATFLDHETAKIDALVAEQEQLITLLKEKRQAVISHAVTKGLDPSVPMKDSGVEWLGAVPEHWEVSPLKRHWIATDCKHITAEFVEDGFPLASIREVQSRWVDLGDAKRTTEYFYSLLIEGDRDPRPGDLIFSRNATVGEIAQVSSGHPPFAMGQDVVLLRRNYETASPDFLQLVVRSPVVTQQLALCMIGSTFKRINVEEIRTLLIAFPPPAEQAAIAGFLLTQIEQFEQLIDEAVLAIELLLERRSALISAAVTGQIDVRGLIPAQAQVA
ncbi:restriction endonuclease subunit S [Ideonella sp.]|uniref:restriction endonuclease subunit S n=1 Tax=Ideonella sp. TaxID=1929293 RepID=UPI003BB5FB4D